MADQFDSLMSAPGALLGLAQLAGGSRAQNQNLTAQRLLANQNMFAMQQQQMAMDRQSDLQSQQLAMQETQSAREFALRREESAFARLNQSLDTQLKIAERESQERDLAFQRSMQAQMFQLQTKQQMLQLERVELENRKIDLQGKVRSRFVKMQSLGTDPTEAESFITDMTRLTEDYEDVMGLDDSAQLATMMSGMIRAAEEMKTPAAKINKAIIPGSDTFNIKEIHDVIAKTDFTKPLDADSRQAVGYILNSALREYDPDELTEAQLRDLDTPLNLDLATEYAEIPREAKVRAALMQYAMEKAGADALGDDVATGNDHLRHLFKELRSPEGRVRFDAEFAQGLYNVVESPEALLELQKVQEARNREDASMAAYIGPSWFSSQYRDAREEMLDGYRDQEFEVLSGGNPLAKRVMGGGLDDFNRVNEEVKRDATLKFTRSDLLEFTGVAGAGRTLGNLVTLNWGALNLSDAADLGMTALWFVPGGALVRGGAWALRGGAAAARGISTGLKMERTAKVAGKIAQSRFLAAPRPLSAVATRLSGRPQAAATRAQQELLEQQATAAFAQAERAAAVGSRQAARAGVQQARAAQALTPEFTEAVAKAGRSVRGQRLATLRGINEAKQARAAAGAAQAELFSGRNIAQTASKNAMFREAASRPALRAAAETAKSQAATATQRVAARRALLQQKRAEFRKLQAAPQFAEEALNAAKAQAALARQAAVAPRQAARAARAGAKAAEEARDVAVATQRAVGRQAAVEAVTTISAAASAPIMMYRKNLFYMELDEASREMNEELFKVEAEINAGNRNSGLLDRAQAALDNYRRIATKYHGGELPRGIDDLLNLRKLYSRSTFSKLQRANLSPEIRGASLADIRMQMQAARTGVALPQTTAPGVQSMTPAGGFNLLASQAEPQ